MALGHRLTTATFDTLAWTAVLVARHPARRRATAALAAGRRGRRARAQQQARRRVPAVRDPGRVALDRELRPSCAPAGPGWPAAGARCCGSPTCSGRPTTAGRSSTSPPTSPTSTAASAGRIELVGQAAVMFSPLIFVVWVAGLVKLLRRPAWRRARPLGWMFLVVTLVFLVTGGKGYYLAGAIVPLVAAGCTWVAQPSARPAGRGRRRARALGRRRLARAGPGAAGLTYADSFFPMLDADQPETIGWPEYAEQVRGGRGRPAGRRRGVHRQLRRGRRLRVVRRRRARLQRTQRLAELGTAARRHRAGRGRRPTSTRPSTSPAASGPRRCTTTSASTTRRRATASGSATGRSARGRRAGRRCRTTTPRAASWRQRCILPLGPGSSTVWSSPVSGSLKLTSTISACLCCWART